MNSKERRNEIKKILMENDKCYKGQELADLFKVTRQVIVKDVALLRAEGLNIIATPDGYMINKVDNNKVKKLIVTCHDYENMEDELKIIVKYGGIVENVIVDHLFYGEIRAMLMIKTLNDVENFINNFNKNNANPLFLLTNGVHIHTVSTDNKENMDNIIKELQEKNILINI